MYTEIGGKKEKNTGKEGQIKETGGEAKSNITWGERKFWSAGVHGVMWRSAKLGQVGKRSRGHVAVNQGESCRAAWCHTTNHWIGWEETIVQSLGLQ